MNILKAIGYVGLASVAGFVATNAYAGSCRSERTFPAANQQDTYTISCKSLQGATTSGIASAANFGSKSVNTSLTSGQQILSQGISSAGAVVCTSQDSTPSSGGTNTVACPSTAVLWRITVNHTL